MSSLASIEAQMKEAWGSALGQVFDQQALKLFYTTLRDIGNVVGDIMDGLGGLTGVLQIASAILITKLAPTIRTISAAAKTAWDSRTLETSIAASNKQYDAMIAKVKQAADA